MFNDKIIFCLTSPIFFSPYKRPYKIIFSKNLIAYFSQISNLIFVNGNKNNTVVGQKVAGKFQTRIHHVQPISMVSACCFGIRFCGLPRDFLVVRNTVRKIIRIDKVIACIVRRINVYHFNGIKVG